MSFHIAFIIPVCLKLAEKYYHTGTKCTSEGQIYDKKFLPDTSIFMI